MLLCTAVLGSSMDTAADLITGDVNRNVDAGYSGYTSASSAGVWGDFNGPAGNNDYYFSADTGGFGPDGGADGRRRSGSSPDSHATGSSINPGAVADFQSRPETSILKLFAISLLWIPLNRRKRVKRGIPPGMED